MALSGVKKESEAMGVINFARKFLTDVSCDLLYSKGALALEQQLRRRRIIRISTYTGLAVLAIYVICFVCPPFHEDYSNATTREPSASDTWLSLSIEDSSLTLDFTPISTNGTFATTLNYQPPAYINVTTNNITGYTLGIKASGNSSNNSSNNNNNSNNPNSTSSIDINRNLISTGERCVDTPTAEKCFISTLEEPVSYLEYSASTATDLNNTWGYMPSKYNSVDNTNYLPAPTSEGDILDATSTPNALKLGYPEDGTMVDNLQPNEYTIDLGSRVDYTTYAGSYSNTFIITAVGNPVPYSVTYNANKPEQAPTTADVDNIPHPQTGNATSGDTIAVILSQNVPTLGNENPSTHEYEYAGYVFNGWCTVQPAEDSTTGYQICPVEQEQVALYQPGDTYGIDQLHDVNTEILYAVWGAPAKVTFDGNGLVFNADASDIANITEYMPVYVGGQITGTKTYLGYAGIYAEPAPIDIAEHYIFKGWSTDQTAIEATYTNEQDIINNLDLNADDDVTLYAVWTYTTKIVFDKNSADGSEIMEPQYIEAGITGQLEQNVYTNTYYIFNGWNTVATPTEQDPGVAYSDQADYQAQVGRSGDVTLYAQWELPLLYNKVAAMSKGTQTAVQLRDGIVAPTSADYTQDTSNSGVYEYNASAFGESSDAASTNKIYYYRGILEPVTDKGSYGSDGQATTYPNYVRLGNDTCWRIVRTTGSGGVKAIYNGIWQDTIESGTCANNQANAQVAESTFNDSHNSVVFAGYTYNSNYISNASTNGVDTDNVLGSNASPAQNNTRSTIKTYIEDTWYADNMTAYTSKLEPSAGYCNDRSLYDEDFNPISKVDTSQYNNFGANKRSFLDDSGPSLTCPRGNVDIYRYVANSSGISNELKYPVALITADETAFAGSGSGVSSSSPTIYHPNSFLCSGSNFWLFSPDYRNQYGSTIAIRLHSGGVLNTNYVSNINGVRPAISFNHEVFVTSGSGTATDPWTINE